jgi:hypothetical protein
MPHPGPPLPLSLPLNLHAVPAPPAPLPAAPLKIELLPVERKFSPLPRVVGLIRPRPSTTHSSPIAQASTLPVFYHRSPSSAPDSVRASPSSGPSGERPLRAAPFLNRPLPPHPRVSLELQDHPPSSTTTRATPPPLNTAARRRLRRLAVDPPLLCAPAPSSLPDTSSVAPSRSPATPCRWLGTTGERATAPSRALWGRGDHAGARTAHARCRGLRSPFSPLGRAARPWPHSCFG